MKPIKLTFYSLMFFLFSCSTTDFIKTSDDKTEKFPSTDIAKIELYSTKEINREYLIIGQVIACADAGNSSSTPIKLLKEQASEIGADAVIDLRLEYKMGNWEIALQASGTAIKFKN